MVVGDSDSEENTECENNLIGAFRYEHNAKQ